MDVPPSIRTVGLATVLATATPSGPVHAQAAQLGTDTVLELPDADDVRASARSAQARFEIRRGRLLPRALHGSSGPCDEVVCRFCTWYDEGEWTPEPEHPEIAANRHSLLAALDSLQALAPSDGWILGQRVWYRYEGGDAAGALSLAESCGSPQEGWWCAALGGFALHVLGRYEEAERSFDAALRTMDLERSWRWRVPYHAADGDARDVFEALRGVAADSAQRVLDRYWLLADPLLLVPGNDRRSEHLARWTVATLRDRARNPYRISWGRDLEELVVRHGWELGWERFSPSGSTQPDQVTGHKHPEGRDYMPPGAALTAPETVAPDALIARTAGPRSLYAPAYAPVLLPIDGQVARFPRGDRFVVVVTWYLPEDTTRHAAHDHARPWLEPGAQARMPDRGGVHLVDLDTGVTRASTIATSGPGAAMVEGGAGWHLLSVEAWSPPARRAGRYRAIVGHRPRPPDVPEISDLLLVTPGERPPDDLEEAAGRALVRPVVAPEQSFGVVWEVAGLGFGSETLTYELTLERTDRSLLARIGGFLGLGGRSPALTLAWSGRGPEAAAPLLQHLDLRPPTLDEGTYEIRIVARAAGRDPLVATASFQVVRGAGGGAGLRAPPR